MRFRHLRQVLRTFGSREAAEAFGKRQGDCKFLFVLSLLAWRSEGRLGRCAWWSGFLSVLVFGYYLVGLYAASEFIRNA